MAKTKISEFSTTAGNNTDINSINIAEGCAPSGINDAIRELMRQLKEFQTGGAGDSVNSGGDFSVATNKFTVASASGNTAVAGTLAVTGTTTLTGALVANGNATLGDGSGDTVTVKGTPTLEVNPTLSGGTANGVLYLNGSKVATSGSALTFDGNTTRNNQSSGTNSYFRTTSGTVDAYFGAATSGLSTGVVVGSFSNNDVVFYQNSSEAMRLTSTGLGVGTSSPAYKLDVAGTGNFQGLQTSGSPSLSFGASKWMTQQESGVARTYICGPNTSTYQGWEIYRATSTGGALLTASFDSSGNLGLGVTPSAWPSTYDVFQFGYSTNRASALFTNGADDTWLVSNAYFNGTNWVKFASGTASGYEMSGGAHKWYYNATSGTGTFTFTQAMTLDASGNLGIGATTVGYSAKSQFVKQGSTSSNNSVTDSAVLVASANANAGENIGLRLKTGAGISGTTFPGQLISAGNNIFEIYTAGATPLVFGTDATERARIDSSGNLLVGTTSVTNSPAEGVQLANGSSIGGVFVGHVNGTATGNYYATFSYNTGIIGSITQNGVSQVLYNISSDQRLKENIADADSASALIDSLQVRQFDWKADGSHQRYGFVAQELITVAPEAVHQPADPEQMMAVDYSKLVPMLVKEIQSLRARVAQLESN